MDVRAATTNEGLALRLVRDLCEALDAGEIEYCHWKSNAFLDRSRTGENDLDLLVRRGDSTAFASVVHRAGFKEARNPSRALPGVVDYYGHDDGADRLVHVHAHYQLVVGDDLTKNYRIPLEGEFLAGEARDGEFRIPARELELILLVIRLTIKHLTWDAILARRGQIPAAARAELAFLEERADRKRVDSMLKESLPSLDPGLFDDCRRALGSSARWERVRVGGRLVAALTPYARRPRAADVGLKVWRRAVGTGRRLVSRRAPRKRLVAGGAVIALVGADGAGKSTAVAGLHRWLARDLAVTVVHLGRPQASWTTFAARTCLRAAAAFDALRGRRASTTERGELPLRSTLRAAFAVALARDRYSAARKARATAVNGGLVVCDRFPLPELALMDAPRVERLLGRNAGGGLARRLAERERRYYRAIGRPDVLIVLRLDPDVAVARKPEESAEFVRGRQREIWETDWSRASAHVVDASRSKEDVLDTIKSIVWSEL